MKLIEENFQRNCCTIKKMCNFAVRKFRDMYAIVEIAGQQFKVTNGQEIFVNRLQGEEGSKVSFDKVLLIDNDGAMKVGTPTVAGANVEATIKEHCKGNKIIVFKKKRRKGYQTSNGHRQYLSKVVIDNIVM